MVKLIFLFTGFVVHSEIECSKQTSWSSKLASAYTISRNIFNRKRTTARLMIGPSTIREFIGDCSEPVDEFVRFFPRSVVTRCLLEVEEEIPLNEGHAIQA